MARLNPLLVVTVAALVTGLAGGLNLVEVVETFGKAFKENRYVSVVWAVLPVIGLLERAGLQERAKTLIGQVRTATTGRLLILYFIVRQITAALGLTSLGGHAQMVRPLIAPMAEAAAETRHGELPDRARQTIRAHAAAVDNIALFFGEDIFIAIASILLIKGFLEQNGILVEPLQLSVWAIPTAVIALTIHGTRLTLLDRRIARTLAEGAKA
ncbi:putative membrane protein [Phenylobacterium koreense]|uniref:Membrane protein n=2 Tax=Caulobacteraceae TaxID=76892 RepID=A0ABV2EFY4_9CAUL